MTDELIDTVIPIFLREGDHVMGEVTARVQGDSVALSMVVTATGPRASDLVAILTSGEPQALRFVAIPVTPPSMKKET